MPKKPAPKTQRKSTKRRKKVKKRKNWIASISAVILAIGFFISFGYYLGIQDKQTDVIAKKELSPSKIFKDIQINTSAIRSDKAGFGIEGMIEKMEKRKKEEKELQEEKPTSDKITLNVQKGKRPKLIIVIDDVAQPRQLKAISALPFKVTPSIFPPSKSAPNSHKLARGLKHFMVHLPMQSGEAEMNKMTKTLMVTDSLKKIKNRVKEIRKLFPNAKFINNHTGSVFTSNHNAMKHLYGSLREHGFAFMDSRTTPKSKVKKVIKSFGDRYIVRDVFLDNLPSQAYIHKQLSQAISIAKKRGHAIAIGHPHQSTIKALRNAKHLLKDVDVVYMGELYR